MTPEFLKMLAAYGELYAARFHTLEKSTLEELRTDWRKAFKFAIERFFYQGRRDKLSERFLKAAVETLEKSDIFTLPELTLVGDWETQLDSELKANRVAKGGDRKMIVSLLKFCQKIEGGNLVRHSVSEIQAGKILVHYKRLSSKESEGVFQIGPKVASLYLRDVVFKFDLEKELKFSIEEQLILRPTDTWVRQLLQGPKEETDRQIQERLAHECSIAEVSASLVNDGAWLIGARAHEILLQLSQKIPNLQSLLKEIEFKDNTPEPSRE